MICALCAAPEASVTVKPLNGLPVGVICCEACRQAVQRRDLGVTVDGVGLFERLRIYGVDGRGQEHTG